MNNMRFQALSTFTTLIFNGGVFAGMAWAGFNEHTPTQPEPPPFEWMDVAPVARKGEIKDEKALPRIKEVAPAPPPEADTASLSREREEAEERAKAEEEKKKKKALAEAERREAAREAVRRKREEEAAREAKRTANKAMRDLRADKDEDAPEGVPDGAEFGTSTDPNAARNQVAYVSLLSTVLGRQFETPANLSAAELKRLQAKIHVQIDAQGKLKGEPRLIQPSGNQFFDQAAMRAVKKFTPGSALRLPLPDAAPLKRLVLSQGITAIMQKK
ncbi:energy transducer TonB [Myxococcota bacterium]|nr:energy transducer TonB [Myxococcota bacterium]